MIEPSVRSVPLSSIRRRTGDHMARSLTESPHASITYEVDYDAVGSARAEFGPQWRERHGFSLTYLPFVCFAACRAIEHYPEVNARFAGSSLEVFERVGLAIAVDLGPRGLVAPVIHDAGSRDLPDLAIAIADLAERARSRRLTERDLQGGTYTITNPGPAGTYSSSPIINQPHAAILAVDGIARRPVVRTVADGHELGIGLRGLVTQAFDHRVFDGAYCGAFLHSLAETVGTTRWLDRIS